MEKFAIETDRLVLRPFELSDIDSYFDMTRDRDIQEYVPYACPESIKQTREDILMYYSKGDLKHDYYLVIENKGLHQMVGALIVTQDANSEFDFCIMIAKEHRRKGYITEATKAFIKILPLNSTLVWKVRKDNVASLQAVKKIQGVQEVRSITNAEGIENRIFKFTV